jgi:ABC-type Fe3+/spermidine/putrescine transport system ATPase subunit
MTVFDNVAYGLKYDGISRNEIRNRVTEMLTFMELLKYRESRINYLSGGEQQRVALSRALVKKPKCLLLDEPLASLDRKIRKQMEIELMRYHSEFGITFIYVTHNQDTAMAISEEMAIMNRGTIEQIGKPMDVYNNPTNLFVGDFLGDLISMPGVISTVSDHYAIVDLKNLSISLRVPVQKEPKEGNEVVVALRPENVIMSSKEIKEDNTIQAMIRVSTFQGNFVKYNIGIENSELTVISNTVFKEGQTVFVRFPNDKLLLFPAS